MDRVAQTIITQRCNATIVPTPAGGMPPTVRRYARPPWSDGYLFPCVDVACATLIPSVACGKGLL